MSAFISAATLIAMTVEMIGVVLFTLDVLDANNENIRRANDFLPVELDVSAIVLSDGPGGKIDFQGSRFRQREGEKLQKIEIRKRARLRIGAACALAGFSSQLVLQAWSLFLALS